MQQILLTLTLLTVFSTRASADSVFFSIEQGAGGAGTFELHVEVVGSNTFGIAGYEFFFNNIDTIENLSPRNAFDPLAVSATGFTLLASADNDPHLVGVQNSTNAASIIYGFGQTAGAFGLGTVNPVPADAVTPGGWGARLLLATGTYSGNPLDIVGDGPGIVNLWATNDGSGATVLPDLVCFPVLLLPYAACVPEPSSVVLLLIGTATLFGSRRRRP